MIFRQLGMMMEDSAQATLASKVTGATEEASKIAQFLMHSKRSVVATWFTLLSSLIITSCESGIFVVRDNDPEFAVQATYKAPDLGTYDTVAKYYIFCNFFGIVNYYNTSKSYDVATFNNRIVEYIEAIEHADVLSLNTIINKVLDDIGVETNDLDSSGADLYALNNNLWVFDSTYLYQATRKRLIAYLIKAGKQPVVSNPCTKQSRTGYFSYEYDLNDPKYTYYPNVYCRMAGVFHFWNYVKYRYVYLHLSGVSWDSVAAATLTDILRNNNINDYVKTIMKLMAQIHDGHAQVRSDAICRVFGKYIANFCVKKINDTFVVYKKIGRQSEPYPIQIGDVITAINGVDIRQMSDSLMEYSTGSNLASRQLRCNGLLLASEQPISQVRYIRGNRLMTTTVKNLEYNEACAQEEIEQIATGITWLRQKIAYVNARTFSNELGDLRSLDSSKGLIIDMRCYPENSTAKLLINTIVPSNKDFFASVYADKKKPGKFRYQLCKWPLPVSKNAYKYKSKVILLVDERTMSMPEFLIMALKLNKNVIVMGSQTAGADGNATFFTFPGNVEVAFSGIGIYNLDLSPTQRVGVKLDKIVTNSISDIQQNTDILIDSAMQYILDKHNNGKP